LDTTAPQPPDFFTVEEAARVLRIGRTAAYALARMWRETDGREGLPVFPVGRLLRVPRAALEEMAGVSITATPAVTKERPPPASEAPTLEPSRPQPPRANTCRHPRARTTSTVQPTLPLT